MKRILLLVLACSLLFSQYSWGRQPQPEPCSDSLFDVVSENRNGSLPIVGSVLRAQSNLPRAPDRLQAAMCAGEASVQTTAGLSGNKEIHTSPQTSDGQVPHTL